MAEPSEPTEPPAPSEPKRPSRGAVLVLLGAVGLGALAAVAVALSTSGEPKDTEETERVALPDPAPPRVSPMTAPTGVGVGWSWVNPLPRAMPPWYGVDVVGPDLVAMVGHAGGAARYIDKRLFKWDTGTDANLWDVAWVGRGATIAVGDGGTLRRLGADDIDELEPKTDATLRAVAALTRTDALVVGDGGTLLRVEDLDVRALDAGTDADLLGVHVRDDTAWVVGSGGTILTVRGDEVRAVASGVEADLRAIGGCEAGDLYAAGDRGVVLRRVAEGWRALQGTGDEPWADVACDGSRAALVGRRGGVLLAADTRSVRLDSGTDEALHAIASSEDGRTWIVGDGGRMAILRTDHVRMFTSGPREPLQDVASLAGTLVAVGEWGRILREKEGRLVLADSPTELALAAIVRVDDGTLIALGDSGVVVRITWKDAELIDGASETSWRDAIAEGGELLGVGTEGTLLRGAPGAFSASRVAEVGDLWALDGSPTDAVAAGEGGAVVHVGADGSTRWPCDADTTWRGVYRDGETTWIVGDGGAIARAASSGCEIERSEGAGEDLYAVGEGPHGRPLAVGRSGVAFERTVDGDWGPVELEVAGSHLRNVVTTERYIYVVGTRGVVLRHVRL